MGQAFWRSNFRLYIKISKKHTPDPTVSPLRLFPVEAFLHGHTAVTDAHGDTAHTGEPKRRSQTTRSLLRTVEANDCWDTTHKINGAECQGKRAMMNSGTKTLS